MRIVTLSLERSAARAVRCERDLSGGTESSPERELAGAMLVAAALVTGLPTGSPSSAFFEDVQLLFGQFTVLALGEGIKPHGAYAYAL